MNEARNQTEDRERRRLTDLALKGDLDPIGQLRLIELLNRSQASRGQHFAVRRESKPSGPIRMSDADREAIRRMGHDPEVVVRMSEVHSPQDYRRIVAETRGGSR